MAVKAYESLKVDVPEGSRGPWRIVRFEVPEHDLRRISYALQGRPVPPGWYTKLQHRDAYEPMMSDTPAEQRDHNEMLWKLREPTTKSVLINGLGIGMVLKWALDQPHVERVDVVEMDADVILLVGPHYMNMAERLGKTLSIYHHDAYEMEWPKGSRWDVAWHDIWPDICVDNLPLMAKLNRKYGRRVGWQGCWSQAICQRQQRSDKDRWGW